MLGRLADSPLSIRDRLMCEYTGKYDPMCFSHNDLSPDEIARACKKFLQEKLDGLKRVGLAPFCVANPAPKVRSYLSILFYCLPEVFFELLALPSSRMMTHGGLRDRILLVVLRVRVTQY